jgi:glutamate racemase
MRLGFFDSGLGGLLVMESCRKAHPKHEYIYLGDTKNLPYGPRESKEVYNLMKPYLLYLLDLKKCDYVIVACNTASVRALGFFIAEFPQHESNLINITESTVDLLAKLKSQNQRTLVLATQGTVKSTVYQSSYDQVAMPGLVELIEYNHRKEAIFMVDDVLSYYPNINNVLLGCTHYLFLQKTLQEKYPHINFIGQEVLLVELISPLAETDIYSGPEYYLSADEDVYASRYKLPFQLINLKK